ncbi:MULTISPECIES: DUF6492 family protein [Kordiimonas]|uniref:DUF6492 family protein n=1 Tax=Kordiimonas TaxID=288021 RepID=UPI00257DC8A7|nr:DUF6492 family protein [Kordiimonas sp. UBA4487]
MERKPLDVVTVVFGDELRLLKLQARSMARYLDPALVGTIFVIVNDPHQAWVSRFIHHHTLPEYGPLGPQVKIVKRDELWRGGRHGVGWQSQQVCKLLVARLSQADAYMILDAKNHFIRKVSGQAIRSADLRWRSHLNLMAPKFRRQFSTACQLFGVEADHDNPCMPTTTPFIADRQLVVDMLAAVEARSGKPFERFFMEAKGRFTEFSLYSAYHLSVRGDFDITYERRNCPTATLFRGARARPDRAGEVLGRLQADADVYCMGVHRAVLQEKDVDIIPEVLKVWQQFGLVEGIDEAAYFMDRETIPVTERMRRFLPI